MKPALNEKLVLIAQEARAARHGEKEAIYSAACKELGISRATLLNKLKNAAVTKPRKQRTDAGNSSLSREEALLISSTLIEATRKNNKRLYSVKDAVEILRTNGLIMAGVVDKETGEFSPLSDSAITRAMRSYNVHPDQLMAPAPASQLASLHPNHVWQIDASICVLYYLRNGKKGLQVMSHDQFYKNKPKNLARIVNDRVWSYEITDHASGWIYVEYVLGSESSEHLCSVLINAMQERKGADVMHGVPHILYMDPGSAPKAAMTSNLCRALGIKAIAHAPRNARATGSVEKARDIIERKFEPGLAFISVNSLEELNALAAKWRAHFNATAIHSRHGKNRNAVWLTITAEQLIKAPSTQLCRELAVAAPVHRTVTNLLRIPFKSNEYDVSTIPGVLVGEKLLVTQSPWRANAAQVLLVGDDGREVYHVINQVPKNALGFSENAAIIGQTFTQHADTQVQHTLREIEHLVTDTNSDADASAARKAKALPFGGRLDPYKHIEDANLPAYLPKRGQAAQILSARIEMPPLSHINAAKLLIDKFKTRGIEWNSTHYKTLVSRFPNGILADELDQIADELIKRPVVGLKVVGLKLVNG